MKTYRIYPLLFILAALACHKDEQPENESDQLLPEEVAILDSLPEAPALTLKDILLPNGFTADHYLQTTDSAFYEVWGRSGMCETPQECKNILLSKCLAVALKLTDRSKYQYPADGPQRPAQNGLAYSYGGKDYTVRKKPPSGLCTEEVFGLDCSGLLYQVFKSAGVNFPIGPADTQRNPNTIRNAVIGSFAGWEDILRVQDLGSIPVEQLQSGDIIYWTRANGTAFHIGLALETTKGQLAVFQSNGTDGTGPKGVADCANNYGPNRGPRTLQLTDPYWFGKSKPYGVVRIVVRDWDFLLQPGLVPGFGNNILVEDKVGVKWMTTDLGLMHYDGKKTTFFTPDNCDMPSIFIDDMAIDANGVLWLASSEGLTSFYNGVWYTYTKDNSNMPYSDVNSIAVRPGGGLWVSISIYGVFAFDSGNFSPVPQPPGSANFYANRMTQDVDGLWTSNGDEFAFYNGNSWTRYPFANLGFSGDGLATAMVPDGSGGFWFGTYNHGLGHFDGGSLSFFTPDNSAVPGIAITALMRDRQGKLWIGYQQDPATDFGLAQQTGTNTWMRYGPLVNDYPFGSIEGLLEDAEGNIWMGQVGGLAILYR